MVVFPMIFVSHKKNVMPSKGLVKTSLSQSRGCLLRGWSQRLDGRGFKLKNIEQQNKEPQNDEVITSIFEIPCSIFCGSQDGSQDAVNLDWFSPEF
jgi:hypothetical protein